MSGEDILRVFMDLMLVGSGVFLLVFFIRWLLGYEED